MNETLGQLLPLAVGVAISPVPIIAAILMLLGPRAGGTSIGFLVGWMVGIAVATTVFAVIAATAGLDDDSGGPSAAASWTKIVLGALLLLVAIRQWRQRPRPGQEASLPKWMAALDSFTTVKAAGLATVLAAVNPKNLLLCAAAGTAIGGAGLAGADAVIAVLVFLVIASSTVAVPVIGFLVARDRLRQPLDELRAWLEEHNAAVMSVLLLVIGVTLVGKGIGGL
jgi:threonine/homoserine/homoserine lactone efflux protein